MRRLFVLCYVAGLLVGMPAQAYAGQKTAAVPGAIRYLPGQVSASDLNRIWAWLKQEVGAPRGLEAPDISVERLQGGRKMGFLFPTEKDPDETLRIAIDRDTLTYDSDTMVLWGVGHELVHYLLLLRQYGFRPQNTYVQAYAHHCDPEFLRITAGVAQVLWSIYHSDDDVSRMNALAKRTCAMFPHQ